MSDAKPPALRIVIGLVVAAALLAAVALLSRERPDPPPPPKTVVEFLPAEGGLHTAWLLAGPFEKPLEAPEKIAGIAATEGEPIIVKAFGEQEIDVQTVEGPGWKLVASDQSEVQLTGEGPGFFYAIATLVSKAGGKRELLVGSYGSSRIWLNGKLLGATEEDYFSGGQSARLDVELSAGENYLILETSPEADRAGFLVFLRKDGETAPEHVALRLARAGRPRLLALLSKTLRLAGAGDDTWCEPGEELPLKLERVGSAPRLDGDISVKLILRPTGGAETVQEQKIPVDGLLAGTAGIAVRAPAGNYLELECVAELTSPGATGLGSSTNRFYSVGNMRSAAADISSRARREAARLGPDRTALALLKAEKALLLLAGDYLGASDAAGALEELEAGRAVLNAPEGPGADPLAGGVGWMERAYICPSDGSAQPYRMYVPKILADPARKQSGSLPLFVFLHGYVESYDKHWWIDETDVQEILPIMEELEGILLVPFGRSNTDFVSIGEVDVLRTIEEVCRLYPVDRDRVYLVGYSMGGYGAYTIGAHFPDRFAAMVVLAGRPIPYYTEQEGPEGHPAYKNYCLNVDTPLILAPNLRHVPVRIFHGTRDGAVPIEGAAAMSRWLQQIGVTVEYTEVDEGHLSAYRVLTEAAPYRWLLEYRRPERPDSIVLRTYSPRFGKSYWANIDSIDRWTSPAQLLAREDGKGQVEVKATNVREFTLSRVAAEEGFKVVGARDYKISAEQEEPGVWNIRGRLKGAPEPGRWQKTADLSGPMKEACNTPFVVVHAPAPGAPVDDGRGPLDDNALKAYRFAEEWRRFAKGSPPVVAEADLSEEDKKTKSIILFCTPSKSALLKDPAVDLGSTLTDTAFVIAGRKAALTAERGLMLTRPNPWCPEKNRYLVVCTGLFYGQETAGNHKLDLAPDFIVFAPGGEGQGEPPAVLAGYFDSDWKAIPRLVEVFPAPQQIQPAALPVRDAAD